MTNFNLLALGLHCATNPAQRGHLDIYNLVLQTFPTNTLCWWRFEEQTGWCIADALGTCAPAKHSGSKVQRENHSNLKQRVKRTFRA